MHFPSGKQAWHNSRCRWLKNRISELHHASTFYSDANIVRNEGWRRERKVKRKENKKVDISQRKGRGKESMKKMTAKNSKSRKYWVLKMCGEKHFLSKIWAPIGRLKHCSDILPKVLSSIFYPKSKIKLAAVHILEMYNLRQHIEHTKPMLWKFKIHTQLSVTCTLLRIFLSCNFSHQILGANLLKEKISV